MTVSFTDLALMPELLETLAALEHVQPTPIQLEAIPPLLEGRDVMGQAQTGTGKTAAFTLPMLQRLAPDGGLQALILTPTRELAIQTAEAIYRYGRNLGVRVLPVYGGQPYERQTRRLHKGVHVVVGTPGRTLDLIRQRALHLEGVRFVILDEADEMLKMGFIEDVTAILAATDPATRQTTVFSATLPAPILNLARTYMRDPLHIAIQSREVTVENIAQRFYLVRESDKVAALSRLLESEDLKNTLVFARTKAGAADLAETLIARGYPAEAIHGDLPQPERERILNRFRNGQLTILVATDVVARGVDIPDVSHVINFDIPQLAIEYVHRIGRTGRAGRGGDAITLVTPSQQGQIRQIAAFTRKPITRAELPERQAILQRRDEQFAAQMGAEATQPTTNREYTVLKAMLELGHSAEEIALAAIRLLRAGEAQRPLEEIRPWQEDRGMRHREAPARREAGPRRVGPRPGKGGRTSHEAGMVRLHMSVGRSSGVRPADVVYTVASTASIPGHTIGAITIEQHETFFDVPETHAEAVLQALKHTRLRGRPMLLARA